jgi:hypothetical protein
MKTLRAYKITLEEVLNAHPADSANSQFLVPVKATLLAFKAGTLVQDKHGSYFIVSLGEWHREGDNTLPQVDAFDKLNSVGLTLLKEDLMKEIFAKEEQKITTKEFSGGQEIREQDNSAVKEISSPVEANTKRQKKSKDRT